MMPRSLSPTPRRASILVRVANLLATLAVVLVCPLAVGAVYAYLVVPRLATLSTRGLDLPDILIIYFLGLSLLTGLILGGMFAVSLYQHLVAPRRRKVAWPWPPTKPPEGPPPQPPP